MMCTLFAILERQNQSAIRACKGNILDAQFTRIHMFFDVDIFPQGPTQYNGCHWCWPKISNLGTLIIFVFQLRNSFQLKEFLQSFLRCLFLMMKRLKKTIQFQTTNDERTCDINPPDAIQRPDNVWWRFKFTPFCLAGLCRGNCNENLPKALAGPFGCFAITPHGDGKSKKQSWKWQRKFFGPNIQHQHPAPKHVWNETRMYGLFFWPGQIAQCTRNFGVCNNVQYPSDLFDGEQQEIGN